MTVDTSATVAIIRRETDAVRLTRALADASVTGFGAPTLLEAGMVLCGRVGEIGQQLLDQFVRDRHIIVIPFLRLNIGRLQFGAFCASAKGAARPH